MGPIEKELRSLPARYVDIWRATDPTFEVCFDAADSLGYGPMSCLLVADHSKALPDVLSEAIEAAEALGI